MTAQDPETPSSRRAGLHWRVQKILNRPDFGLLIGLLIVVAILGRLAPYFLTTRNIINIARDSSIVFVVAAGMTIALVGGGLDLSVGAVMAVAGVMAGGAFRLGLPMPVASLIGVATGALIGAINGLLITRGRINPLIATLGTMGLFRGLCYAATGGQVFAIHDEAYRFARAQPWGIPVPIFVMVIVLLAVQYVLAQTQFGRHLYAVGGNANAARQAALDVERTRLWIYVCCATLAGIAGVVGASVMGLQDPTQAVGRELDVATAVLLGGASLSGGAGTIQGTLVGVFFLATIANGMIGMGIHPEWQYVLRGVLLVGAVVIGQRRAGGYR
jgi:ribose transport system permease protein